MGTAPTAPPPARGIAGGTELGDALDDDHDASSSSAREARVVTTGHASRQLGHRAVAISLGGRQCGEVRGDDVDVTTCDRSGERALDAERLHVVDRRSHQREQRRRRHAGGVCDAERLRQQRHDVVRRDRGGRVIGRASSVGDPERAHAQGERDPFDLGRAIDRTPRAGEPFRPELRRGQRLERVQRSDLDVGPREPQLVELGKGART